MVGSSRCYFLELTRENKNVDTPSLILFPYHRKSSQNMYYLPAWSPVLSNIRILILKSDQRYQPWAQAPQGPPVLQLSLECLLFISTNLRDGGSTGYTTAPCPCTSSPVLGALGRLAGQGKGEVATKAQELFEGWITDWGWGLGSLYSLLCSFLLGLWHNLFLK